MTEYIEVNGAKIEKGFFNDNLKEAKSYSWNYVKWNDDKNHVHCMICGISIPDNIEKDAYKSKGGWLCKFCFDKFIRVNNVGVVRKNSIYRF